MSVLPQVIWLLWNGLLLGVMLSSHGKPREGKYNFYYSVFVAISELALLAWGGFFNPLFR